MKILTTLTLLASICSICDTAEAQRRRGGKGGGGNLIKRLDKDNDGKISKSEAEGTRLAKRFDALDANKDGFITQEELAKGRRRGRGGKRKNGGGK